LRVRGHAERTRPCERNGRSQRAVPSSPVAILVYTCTQAALPRMSDQLALNRPSADRVLASLRELRAACQPEQEASEEPLIPAETMVDLDFLEKRVALFIGRGWPDKVLEGLAEVYADVAASVNFLLGLEVCTPAQKRQGICTTLVRFHMSI
jgi:hypothetical protein